MSTLEDDVRFEKTVPPDDIIDVVKNRIESFRRAFSDVIDGSEDSLATTDARAEETICCGNIKFDAQMGCFLVRGSGDTVHMVKLGKKPACSCRPHGTCYHITAVLVS